MKERRRERILPTIGAVSCVVSMILSVTVLPAIAYANVTKNPLFVVAMAAAAENNRGQSKSGEGGAEWGAGKEGAGKEVKGDKTKEVDKKEGNRAAKGGAAKDSERVDNKGSKGNSENPNVVGSVSNSNSNGNGAGNGTGDAAGNGAKSGKDADGENKKLNVPANAPKNKSKEKDKQADKNKKNNKANGKDAKEKAKKKAKGKDRSAGDMEKLSLEQVKKLPACVGYRGSGFFSNAIIFRPDSGSGNACAISADKLPTNFDSIRREISKLNNDGNGSVDFFGAFVYAYGSLSKGKEGLFSGKTISSIGNYDRFDVSNVTDMSYLFKDSSLTDFSFLSSWNVSKVTNMSNMFEGCAGLSDISSLSGWNVGSVTNMKSMFSAIIADEDKRESFDLAG